MTNEIHDLMKILKPSTGQELDWFINTQNNHFSRDIILENNIETVVVELII